MERRQLLKAGAGLALVATFARPAAVLAARSPFHWMPVIDGSSGSNLFFLPEGDPDVPHALAQLRAANLAAMMVTVAPQGRFWLDDAAFKRAQAALDTWHRLAQAHPQYLRLVGSAADIDEAHARGQTGVIPWFQGTEPLGEDLDRITMFRERGIRVIQLTHNRRNLVGDGAMEPGNAGLSQFGRQVIERIEAARVVLDLAHGSQRTMAEGVAAATRPMLISHTGCRALADLPRNTDDATLRAMADKGGVAGIIFWPYLRTDTQPMAIDVIAHIEHAVDVCGEDHVGIGTDTGVEPIERTPKFEAENLEYMRGMKHDGIFGASRPDALYTFIPDLNTSDRFERLALMLSKRGHPDARIAKILGGNFLRVMRQVWGG